MKGENKTGTNIFDDLKVVEFAWVIVTPTCTRYLADHGATVVKVESRNRPDVTRFFPPFKDNIEEADHNCLFPNFNCNKYGVTLNLRDPRGIALAKRLIAWADVVADGFSAGVMETLGLGYEEVKEINARAIMIRSCMQGQTGPRRRLAGYGTALAALTGFIHSTGWPDRVPTGPFGAYTDPLALRLQVSALIAALDYRRRTGKGQCLDLSHYEAGLQFITPYILDFVVNGHIWKRMGNASTYAAPHGVYPCKGEDGWCAIGIFNEEEWNSFCKIVGQSDWLADVRFSTLKARKENEDELNALVAAWSVNMTPEEAMARLQASGVAAGVVHTGKGIHEDFQLKHRKQFWWFDHPVIGPHSVDAAHYKLSKSPARQYRSTPHLGRDNEHVFVNLLGMPDIEFAELVTAGVME